MKFLNGAAAVIITMALIACEDTSTGSINDIEKIVFPASLVSYNRTVQPLLNIGCATTGCHDRETRASNLDLSDYLGFRQRFYDIVIINNGVGDTINSRLIWNLEGRVGASPMPPQRSLNDNQIRGFKQWILEGATDTIP
ncbi:MAG: hypothetical protein WCW35_00730 [Bacteroidota bacterium]